MGVVKQLYQLQEVDLEIEADERALSAMVSRLGENKAVVEARDRLTAAQRRLDELKHHQRGIEWEIEDLVSKITALEGELYSGRIKNPKELSNLQREVDELKARRSQVEDRALEIMDQVELAQKALATITDELRRLEADWQSQQQRLSAELKQLKQAHSELSDKRQQLMASIEPQVIEVYRQLRREKGTAIARVEQGTCRGCQIALPTTELQLSLIHI